MNILEIIVLVVLAAIVYDGYKRGLVKTVFSVVKMIIGAIVAAVVCSAVTGVIGVEFRYIVPVAFIAVVGIVLGILGAVENLLDLVTKIPVAKQVNKLAGIVAGLAKAVITIWILFAFLGFFADTGWGATALGYMNDSETLSCIESYNPLNGVLKNYNFLLDNENINLYN